MAAALSGLRVLDFTCDIAGPFCTKQLSSFGAEVVKIEPPSGDPARGLPPFLDDVEGPERSGMFAYLNTGKKSVVLDIVSQEGRAAVLRLVPGFDVVVESFAPDFLPSLGLGYAELSRARPGLVMTSVTNFGQRGPDRDREATEITLMAASGFMSIVGEPDREPLKLGGSQAQLVAGLNAAGATIAAVLGHRLHGRGAHVDISIQQCAVDVQLEPPVVAAIEARRYPRDGSRHRMSHPMTILPCADGYTAATATGSGPPWEMVAMVTEEPRLLDPRFETAQTRRTYADEVDALLLPWLMKHTRQEIFEAMQEVRVPFGKVMDVAEMAEDRQFVARELRVVVPHPVLGAVPLARPPARLSATPAVVTRAPLLGEHTEATLGARRVQAAARPAAADGPIPGGPLEGIRVLDLTMVWAGPYVTSLLADLGAMVVKVESTRRIDGTRVGPLVPTVRPARVPWEQGGFFNRLNRNKLSLTLNLADARGRDLFLRLVPHFDAVVENYAPRVMPNFGLGYEELHKVNPRLVMLSMPGFGLTGPYRDYTALGSTLEPMGGLSAVTGYENGPPLRAGIAYADPIAGLNGAAALLAGLVHQRSTGQGQFIELPQVEATAAMIPEAQLEFALNGRVLPRMGNRDLVFAPQGLIRAAGTDRWVAFSVRHDADWGALCAQMGRPELSGDLRFASPAARRLHHDEALEAVRAWAGGWPEGDIVKALDAAGVPASVVCDNLDVFRDPQLRARGAWVEVDKAAIGPYEYPSCPWRVEGYPEPAGEPAPELGRDTAAILKRYLGVDDGELAELEEAQVIGSVPLRFLAP